MLWFDPCRPRATFFFLWSCFTMREWRELFIVYSIESETLGMKRGAANLRWVGARSALFLHVRLQIKKTGACRARARSAAKTHWFIVRLALSSVSCQFDLVSNTLIWFRRFFTHCPSFLSITVRDRGGNFIWKKTNGQGDLYQIIDALKGIVSVPPMKGRWESNMYLCISRNETV